MGGDMYVEKESGTVGSTIGEEGGGEGVELKMIDGSFRCHVCHATLIKCIWCIHNVHMHIYTPLQCHSHCGSEEVHPVVVLLP